MRLLTSTVVGTFVLTTILAACGSKDDHGGVIDPNQMSTGGTVPTTTGGTGGSSGSSGAGVGGTGGSGGSTVDVGAPVVTITSPTAVTDPNSGDVVTKDEVDVVCSATKSLKDGAAAVDPGSVKIAVLDANGKSVRELPGTPTGTPNEYHAELIVSDIANGTLTFTCSANDTSAMPKTGTGSVQTFLDQGPEITLKTPVDKHSYPAKGSISFDFTVGASPVAKGDTSAKVSEVTLNVAGVDVPVTSGASGRYTASVNMSDAAVFAQPPPSTVPFVIRAKNSRKPNAVERVGSYSFNLDSEGPVITLKSPLPVSGNPPVVGGRKTVPIQFTVTDALSDVDSSSVVVTIETVEHRYGSDTAFEKQTGDAFTYNFDISKLLDVPQVTVIITAQDSVGNKTKGESFLLWLDNQPPVVTLDPANVRERRVTPSPTICTDSFDPLGKAIGDGGTSANAGLFRAVVWDQTNITPGQPFFHYSGTNTGSVQLFLQPDISKPLLIDTNSDGVCDQIATDSGATPLNLVPVDPRGTASQSGDAVTEPQVGNACTLPAGISADYPCQNHSSDLMRVIKHNDGEDVIYAAGPLNDAECTGTVWQIGTIIAAIKKDPNYEGWICLAATATDNATNVGISAPLRVCYDSPKITGTPDCAKPGALATAPSCTTNCTAPTAVIPGIVDDL